MLIVTSRCGVSVCVWYLRPLVSHVCSPTNSIYMSQLTACRLPLTACYLLRLLPATSCSCCLLPAACSLLLAPCCSLDASCFLPATYFLLLAACCLLPVAYCLLLTACHMLRAAFHFPLSTFHWPLTTCHLPPATCHLPFACQSPLATCHLPLACLLAIHCSLTTPGKVARNLRGSSSLESEDFSWACLPRPGATSQA